MNFWFFFSSHISFTKKYTHTHIHTIWRDVNWTFLVDLEWKRRKDMQIKHFTFNLEMPKWTRKSLCFELWLFCNLFVIRIDPLSIKSYSHTMKYEIFWRNSSCWWTTFVLFMEPWMHCTLYIVQCRIVYAWTDYLFETLRMFEKYLNPFWSAKRLVLILSTANYFEYILASINTSNVSLYAYFEMKTNYSKC